MDNIDASFEDMQNIQVAVIMSTYNGEKYLREQLDSILNQINVGIELFIRDDGSTDSTHEILEEYKTRENVHVNYGKNAGYARSFMKMLKEAGKCEYYAFSDQDDYWEPEKLYRALVEIKTQEKKNRPILYYSNLMVTDIDLNIDHVTKIQNRKKTLQSTFIRRSIAGNTMVFNSKLCQEIFSAKITDALLRQGHDSFIVSLCYALDGIIICDKNAYIKYRQHVNNTAGAPVSAKSRIRKEIKAIKKEKGYESGIAKAILDGWRDKISPEKQEVLELISSADRNIISKIKILFSPSYGVGDIRLTLVGKLKLLR